MKNSGWISIHRRLTEHWIWENPRELKWWLTILLYVNHEPTKVSVSDGMHDVSAGESFMSIERWADLFGCAKKTALKFFHNLEKDGMIERKILGKGNRRKHLLSVANWDKYQNWKPVFTPKQNPNVPPNNNDNNDNNENRGGNIIPTLDEFIKYATSKKPDVDIETLKLKYLAWTENGWRDGYGKTIANWKTKLLNTMPHFPEKKQFSTSQKEGRQSKYLP